MESVLKVSSRWDKIMEDQYVIGMLHVTLSSSTRTSVSFGGVEFSILYSQMGSTGLTSVGCAIFSINLDPIEPLSLLPICMESFLLKIPNSAASLLFPWVNYTSSSPGVCAVNLIVGVTAAAVFMFLFLLYILTSFSNRLIFDNVVETLSRMSS